jgi:hypothetical protein
MSSVKKPDQEPDSTNEEEQSGFNLKLAYSLLALAIVAAICIALFIVLPFYHRH